MQTGYTTSVEYRGVTYHVQTEDKGMDARVVVSLVYDRGTVLATKRTTYAELVGEEFDSSLLSKKLRQQHKLICAAIMSGRLDDLKRLSAKVSGKAPAESVAVSGPEVPVAIRSHKNLAVKVERGLRFKSGDRKSLQIIVVSPRSGTPLKGAQVTLKIMGTGFRSLIMHSRSDESGVANFELQVPHFKSGRGAIVVSASLGDDYAELRRVVSPR